jgi:hypothetical protein
VILTAATIIQKKPFEELPAAPCSFGLVFRFQNINQRRDFRAMAQCYEGRMPSIHQ